MNATNSRFPVFVENQLLKAEQLNSLVNFLDKESRNSRIYSIGIGIVRGLAVSYDETNKYVVVSDGLGISSDGYLFSVSEECNFKYYESVKISANAFKCDVENRFSLEGLTDFYQLHETVPAGREQFVKPVSELLEKDGQPQNRCLTAVMLWSLETVERAVCLNECDEAGSDTYVSIKVLLADAAFISEHIVLKDPQVSAGISVAGRPPYVRRPIWVCKQSGLEPIISFHALAERYKSICEEAIKNILPAYKAAGEEFGDDLGVSGVGNAAFETCLNALSAKYTAPFANPDIQYFYAFLKDLVAAYVEFAESLRDFQTGGILLPDRCQFPGFIALGQLGNDCQKTYQVELKPGTLSEPRIIKPRTPFQPTSLSDQKKEGYLRAQFLLDRMGGLCNQAALSTLQANLLPIRITACKGRHLPLSQRAIPIYYNSAGTRPIWNFDLTRNDNALPSDPPNEHVNRIPSWHRVNPNAPPPFDEHLLYDTDAFAFFRIEGHVGWELEAAVAEIEKLRACNNLPFDIKCVKLGRLALPNAKLTSPQFQHLENLYLDVLCDLLEMDREFVPPLPATLSQLVETGWQSSLQIPSADPAFDCYFELINKLFDQHQRLASEELFAQFVLQHPGTEHLGGVPKGGTFILAYEDSLSVDAAAQVETKRNQFDELRKAGRWEEAQKIQNEIKVLTAQLQERVVADFCLPYYCCSGQPPASPRIEPLVFIYPNEFCKGNQAAHFEVITYPSGGSLKGDAPKEGSADYVQLDGGKWYFYPGRVKVDSGTVNVKLTYTLANGTSASTLATVERKTVNASDIEIVVPPYLGLTYNPATCEVIGREYLLRYTGEGVTWSIKGQTKDISELILVSALIGEKVPVEVQLNGGCIGRVELDLPFCPHVSQEQPYHFNFPDEFKDQNEEHQYKIIQGSVNSPVPIDMYPTTTQLVLVPDKVTINGVTHPLTSYITNDGTPCNERKYSLNVAGLPAQDLPPLPVGKYQFQVVIPGCTASPIANLTILEPQANRPVPSGGSGANTTVPATGGTTTTNSTGGGRRSPAHSQQKSTSADTAEEVTALLNQRLLAHKAILAELNKSGDKISTAGMSKATNFLMAQIKEPSKLNKEFKDLTFNLFSQLKTANAEKRRQIEMLLSSSLHHFLDKQVTWSPAKTNGDALEILQKVTAKMKALNLDLTKARTAWKGDELKKALNAKAVNEYLKALK